MKPRSVTIGGLARALPKVRFQRHRTPRSLLTEFFRGMPVRGMDDVREAPAMLEAIKDMGVWAFVHTWKKAGPVVHFWLAPTVDPLHAAYVLGHEVGHVSGRKLHSRRNSWREELRADEYGAAAFLAMAQVLPLLSRRRQGRRSRR